MLAALLAGAFIAAYVFVGVVTIKTMVIDGPAFESKAKQFDLRINYGDHVRVMALKPAPIVWEEPEAYFEVATERRVTTGHHTYIVERMGC